MARGERFDDDARVRHEGQLRVHVAELLRDLGSRMSVQRSVSLESVAVVDAAVSADGLIAVDLVLDSLSDGLVASGSVAVPWEAICRRCLGPVTGSSTHKVQEVFTRDGDGDTYVFHGDEVDLEPLVRDAAALGLPLAPLCGDECRGPDPERFPARPADDQASIGDPRWAALDQLTFDDGGDD